VMLHLAEAFVGQGHKVDLVLCQLKGPYANRIPPGVNLIELRPTAFGLSRIRVFLANPEAIRSLCLPILLALKPPKTIRYLHSLASYLRREQPAKEGIKIARCFCRACEEFLMAVPFFSKPCVIRVQIFSREERSMQFSSGLLIPFTIYLSP